MNTQLSQEEYLDDEGLGWLFFAGTILGIAGIMRIFDSLWAFRYDGVVPDELEGALLGTSLRPTAGSGSSSASSCSGHRSPC